MKEIQDYLEKELKQLKESLAIAEKYRRDTEENKKTLYINKRGNHFQYYILNQHGKREYVKAEKIDEIKRMATSDYYKKVLKKSQEQIKAIEKFIGKYEENAISNIYEELSEGRRQLITPLILSEDQFIQQWLQQHQGMQNTYEMKGKYTTDKGELVRSKSEKILADMFYKYNIPYQYEPALKLKNGNTIYPDFVLLNVKQRKTYYWEHLGLASEETYASKNMEKLGGYEINGVEINKNLIITIESEKYPLDIRFVEKKVKDYLL